MTKRKKKKDFYRAEVVTPVELKIAEPFTCPDISVIIPMYNAEKFIGECLDSLLAQTFKNFEVIVVDDGSTDNSSIIVESYKEKFSGRLTLFRLKKNSGGAGIPRNTGIMLARGEFIYFMDSDDRIVENALEDDFLLAKKYNTDVIYHTRFYNLSADGTKSEVATVPKYTLGDEIVLDEDLLTRVTDLVKSQYYHAPWRSFSRRTFLIENELYFPNMSPYEDIVWNYALFIYTKRFLRVPTPIYFYRDNEHSTLRREKTVEQNIKFYLNPIILGLKSLDKFIRRNEFFDTKPYFHYAILENYFNGRFLELVKKSDALEPYIFYDKIKEEFGETLGEYDVLISALCAAIAQKQKLRVANLQQFKEYITQSEKKIAELEDEINQRKKRSDSF